MKTLLHVLPLTILVAGCPDPDPPPAVDAGTDAEEPQDDFHDPLSTPEEPTLDVGAFLGASECGACHTNHVEQWSQSMHAYAMVDPVFRALVAVRQADFEGTQDQFCTQCHSAIGTRGGEIVDGFAFEDLSPVVLEGITCESCHRVTELRRTYNSGHFLETSGPVRGSIEDPMASPFHESSYDSIFEKSEFCAGCHDVIEVSGLNLERPYEEWLESNAPAAGTTCQTCHMPTYRGRATEEAPERDLHDHTFVGVDVPLSDGFVTDAQRTALEGRVVELLTDVATATIDATATVTAGGQIDVVVSVRNDIPGHNLPTGSTFVRQMWLEVIATDMATGEVVYETGTLDTNGDLRDYFSDVEPFGDADLIVYHSTLLNASGQPEIFSWRATEHVQRSLPPGHTRTHTLFVPTETDLVGPVQIAARVRFRTHPPFLLRRLGLASLVDRLRVHDLATASATVTVVPP